MDLLRSRTACRVAKGQKAKVKSSGKKTVDGGRCWGGRVRG